MRRVFLTGIGAFALAVVVRAARTWFPVRVQGTSMSPTLGPDQLLAARPPRRDEPRAGQIVIARLGGRDVIKRVGREPRDGTVWLVGDNHEGSTDSRTSGSVAIEDVVGVVRVRYWPLARAGRIG